MTPRLFSWAEHNPSIGLDLIRIYLGLGLFVRGLMFLGDPGSYIGLLPGGGESAYASTMVMHYVALAHLGGGLLLAGGLLTRTAAIVQIPILLGATFVVHFPETLFAANQSFAFSALVLALLGVFAIWGGGPWSLDQAISLWNEQKEADEAAIVERNARLVRERPRPRRPAPGREPTVTQAAVCTCDDASGVVAERSYSGVRRLRFVTGTHPLPSTVTLRCTTCGGVVEQIDDPAAMEAYRYAPDAGI